MYKRIVCIFLLSLMIALNMTSFADEAEDIEKIDEYHNLLLESIQISEPINPYYISPNKNINVIINIDEQVKKPVYVSLYKMNNTFVQNKNVDKEIYDKLDVSLTMLKPVEKNSVILKNDEGAKNITNEILVNNLFNANDELLSQALLANDNTNDASENPDHTGDPSFSQNVVLPAVPSEVIDTSLDETLKVDSINAYYEVVKKIEEIDQEIESIYQNLLDIDKTALKSNTDELRSHLETLSNQRQKLRKQQDLLMEEYNANFEELIFSDNIVTQDKMRNYYHIEKNMPTGNYILTLEDDEHTEFYSMTFTFLYKDDSGNVKK